MASLITCCFEVDNLDNCYFRAKALKKLSKLSQEERAMEKEYNRDKGCHVKHGWSPKQNQLVTESLVGRVARETTRLSCNLHSPENGSCGLWYTIGTGEDIIS